MSCRHCDEIGILRVEHEGFGTLAICDFTDITGTACVQGKKQIWKLPKVSSLGRARVQTLNPEDFKPTSRSESGTFSTGTLDEKVRWWREKLSIAETYWATAHIKKLEDVS
jgi:hypothetical protein